MEGFHMVKDLVKPHDWLAKVDLKDAYFLVPMDPNHCKFLQCQWQGITYQFQCLPFGLSCAPRTFTKLMKPVVGFLRERGIQLIVYLDDLLIFGDCQGTLVSQLVVIKDLFQADHLINEKKSQLEASQQIVFLGLAISTTAMPSLITQRKLARIQTTADKDNGVSTETGSLCGHDDSSKTGSFDGPLFHRHLQALINRVVPLATSVEEVKQSYHQMVVILANAKEELMWWVQEVQKYNGAPLLVAPPDMVIESDASHLGWEATLKGQELRTGAYGQRRSKRCTSIVWSC